MAEIAVKVIDPGGYQFAQLVDNRQPVRKLIPLLVQRLDLPDELNYQLIPSATGQALVVDSTLAGAGIQPGAELLLRPARDSLLQMFLDKLYDEAKSYVKDQLWDLAKQRLAELFRLDPRYPDRNRLQDSIEAQSPTSAAAPPPLTTDEGATSPAAQATSNAAGCWVVFIVAAVALVYYKPWQYLDLNQKGPNQAANPQQPNRWQAPVAGNGGPAPQLGTGDVQVTLRWTGAADLDLHVVTPFVEANGQREVIWYNHRDNTRSGGRLDVDANSACVNLMRDPVENVFWPVGRAPRGEYQVYVNYFTACAGSGPTNYEVSVRVNGQVREQVRGTVDRAGERKLAASFRY